MPSAPNPVSLLDIAPPELSAEDILVGGEKKSVHGLGALAVAKLFRRFPVMAMLAAQKAVPEEDVLPAVLEAGPFLIAAGMGQSDNPDLEAKIGAVLRFDEAINAHTTIMRLTGPAGPLLDAADESPAAKPGEVPATK